MTTLLRRATLAAAAAALLAPAAHAQQFLPIRPGQTLNGTLAEATPSQTMRGRFQVYRFTAEAGQTVIVTMRSNDFDAYLTVGRQVGGILDPMKEDDDRGGNTDARLRFTAPAAGQYVIVAQALSTEATGAYTLELQQAPVPTTAAPVALRYGQSVDGSLAETDAVLEDDESYYDTYTFQGRAGQRIEIVMRSTDFDTYLAVGRMDAGELQVEQTDDDSGEGESGTDSRIRLRLEEDGEYTIRANSLGGGETGAYSLTLTERPTNNAVAVPQPIRAGQDYNGELAESDAQLDDDSYYDYWVYEGRAGETIRITMKSEDFDTFLAIGMMEGGEFSELSSNDDGGDDGVNSMIEFTLPSAGRYIIRTNSLLGEQTGAYVVRVESQAGG